VLAKRPDEVADFFKNGSFGVLRKMEQDEAAFNTFVGLCAASLGETREYVISKFVGRWPDGQVIDARSHSSAPKALPKGVSVDDFDFTQDDRGVGCPFGSHIRRMNPRKDAVVPSRRRPLVRRGMPYGKPFAKGNESDKRGLMGLFFCASIEDQFEHLVAEWAEKNPMGINNQGDCKDPLTGSHGAAPSIFDIPMPDGSSRKIVGFRPFVITRGTLYAFFPSKPALQAIANS
jgi:deferrochelatase/peroxidase EfeB